jgi:hypothetical protein
VHELALVYVSHPLGNLRRQEKLFGRVQCKPFSSALLERVSQIAMGYIPAASATREFICIPPCPDMRGSVIRQPNKVCMGCLTRYREGR